MSLKVKKLYIDTRYKTIDSKSNSDFKIHLPESLSFESNSVFYIDDFCCGHSWKSIENFNNRLYLYVSQDNNVDNKYGFIIYIADGNYNGPDFAVEVQTKMRAATNAISVNLFNVSYDIKNNNLTIAMPYSGYSFKILTPLDLKTSLNNAFVPLYDKSNPYDINEVLSNLEGVSGTYYYNVPFISGFLNFQPINNIYLHSSTIGNYNSLSCDGSQTVIKKIPVNVDYGIMLHDQCVLFNDYNDCSHQSLKTIDFQLKTVAGYIIPLHGVNVNFSIIFSRADTTV